MLEAIVDDGFERQRDSETLNFLFQLDRHANAEFNRSKLATPLNYSRASAKAVCKIL